MNFKKYCSIENIYREKEIQDIRDLAYDREQWVVTEKIHGSNFSFWMNREGLRCAKRTSFLRPTVGLINGENFFNWESVVEAYNFHLSVLYKTCVELFECEEVVLYGELFGGSYNHPDIPRAQNATVVQKGVMYAPWNDFYAFDLKIDGLFVNYNVFDALMNDIGFIYATPLFIGTLDECLEYPNDNITELPTRLGLPTIEGNIGEGVVIKPVEDKRFKNGSRIILKNKNDKFKEVQSQHKVKIDVSLTEEETELVNLVAEYINENRLHNVVSKIGEIDNTMFGKLSSAFMSDIYEDFIKDHGDKMSFLEKARAKIVSKEVTKLAQIVIRNQFINIIDGTF